MVNIQTTRKVIIEGGLDGILNRIQGLKKLYVGILQEKATRKGDDINNASLLYIHTHGIRRKAMREEMQKHMNQGKKYSVAMQMYVQAHGSPLWHSPPRPVIEPAIKAHKKEIAEEFSKAAKAAAAGDIAKAGRFIQRTGMLAQNYCRAWFTDSRNGWAPNSPLTIERKTKGKGGKTNPLIDTAAMRKAIIYVMR